MTGDDALACCDFAVTGADSGYERVAAIYNLIGTAKLNGIDPEAYLRAVLRRIANHLINQTDESYYRGIWISRTRAAYLRSPARWCGCKPHTTPGTS